MPAFALHLLGPPRLDRNGDEVHVSRRKAMALLAYLAVERRRHRRDSLAALLWPLYDQTDARAELRRHIHVLRRILGSDALDTDRETVALSPDLDLWLDIEAFRGGLAACDSHASPEACEECAPHLERAVDLYRDGFLAGFSLEDSAPFDEWQTFQAQVLRDEVSAALARLTHWYEEAGDTARGMAHARKWLRLDPVHEPAHRALMRLYAETGQDAAALRQYRQCVRVLETELGLAPSAETTALYNAIRARRARAPEPVGVETGAREPPAFLDEDAPDTTPSAPLFVGREPELARLNGYLDETLDGQGQVAFVIGGPGRGKSSLMRAFAQRAMAAHSDLLVLRGACNALAGVGDPYLPFREVLGMLTGDVASLWAFGAISRDQARRLWRASRVALEALVQEGPHLLDILVPAQSVASRLDQLGTSGAPWEAELRKLCAGPTVTGLRQLAVFQQTTAVLSRVAARQPLLILLDDLQWMDAGSIGLLFHLSRRLAGQGMLVLGAYRPEEVAVPTTHPTEDGEAVHTLGRLLHELKRDHGDVWIDLRESDEATGRQFVDAFIDSEPNQLGEAFRDALFDRTGGHPLFTVELLRTMQDQGDLQQDVAGAWVVTDQVAWDRLPARVEAVVAARLDRLAPEQRDLLTVASVEGETFTAEAVAQVEGLGHRSVLRALGRELAGRHRLVREAGIIEADGRRLSRFAFSHALFQECLYQDLTEGERCLLHGEVAAALEALHGAHTDEVAAQLAHHFDRAGDSTKAVEYAARAGERARLAYAHDEAIRHYERCLEIAGDAPSARDQRWQLLALSGLGKIFYNTGRLPEAETHLRQAIDVGKAFELDPQEMARLYYWLGETLFWREDYQERFRIGREGRKLVGDDDCSLGAALMNQTMCCFFLGNDRLEEELTAETASFILDLPYTEELRAAFCHIWMRCRDQGDLNGAGQWSQELERRAEALGDLTGLLEARLSTGLSLGAIGDWQGTLWALERVLKLANAVGSTAFAMRAHMLMATCCLSLADPARAEPHARQAKEIGSELGNRYFLGLALECYGVALLCRGAFQEAIEALSSAAKNYASTGTDTCLLDCRRISADLGRLHLASGDTEGALQSLLNSLSEPSDFEGDVSPVVHRLAALEDALADPDAFRAWCDRYHADHPDLRTELSQWYLIPAEGQTTDGPPVLADTFDDLDPAWVWSDPFGDCSRAIERGLVIRAANGRVLWHPNTSAPRVTRALPTVARHAMIQTLCSPVDASHPAIGGLLLWGDDKNWVCLTVGDLGDVQISLRRCSDGRPCYVGRGKLPGVASLHEAEQQPTEGVGLRLVITGQEAQALCSREPGGDVWYSVGTTPLPTAQSFWVGVCAEGLVNPVVYRGAHPNGSAIRFESFTIWEG